MPVAAAEKKVFLDYTQAELDAAYDQTVYAPNRQQVLDRNAANSQLARQRLGEPLRRAYGPSAIEQLDIWRADASEAPVLVFIHGGAWRAGLAKNYGFIAEPFVRAGAHVVIPDFAWVQDVGGSLLVMAEQVRRAIAWTWHNIRSFGGDRQRLHLAGHSSGAHLAACALTTDWPAFDVPQDLFRTALLSSGMYDLAGPRLSARSQYVRFDDETETALSPQRHLARIKLPLIVAYAALDTPEFQRQSRDFAAALQAAGKPVELIRGEHYNHFEALETLANPYGILGSVALRQLGL